MVTAIYSLRGAFFRFVSLFRKRQLDRELSDELESHLREEAERQIKLGLTPQKLSRCSNQLVRGPGTYFFSIMYRNASQNPSPQPLSSPW